MRGRRLILPALALLLSGCAVRQETPSGIVVEYDAYHPEFAQLTAKKHCARYSKVPVLAKLTEPAPSPRFLYLLSQVAVFDCVEPAKPAP